MRSLAALAVLTALFAPALVVSTAHAEDRYGPAAGFAVETPSGPMLSWPGKTQPSTRPALAAAPSMTPLAATSMSTTATPRSASAGGRSLPTSLYDPPSAPATPSPTTAPADAGSQPLLAGMQGAPPRYYSVHRQYGLQPDPIEPLAAQPTGQTAPQAATPSVGLSPQFLADSASADLAEPPPLPPQRLSSSQAANMTASAATNQARAAAEASQAGDAGALN